MQRFEIDQPLPDGPMLLEASAGTGKTTAIAGLSVRFLLEQDLDIANLTLLTFNVQAATELRSRLLKLLQDCVNALAATLSGETPDHNELIALICAADPQLRLDRARTALADFEQAQITTIHSYCQRALTALGVLGDWDPKEKVVGDSSHLATQAASDVFLGRFAHQVEPDIPARSALQLAPRICASPLPLAPDYPAYVDFFSETRRRYCERKRELGLVSFDDLQQRLLKLLAGRDREQAARWLRQRSQVVMVDEFQDTDPEQWAIIEQVFVAANHRCILIGDPKQAIYGFRNADVGCYLAAAHVVPDKRTLNRNYRSDQSVVAGITELFGNVELGQNIGLVPVQASHPDSALLLEGSNTTPARVWVRTDAASPTEIALDVVEQVRRLLTGSTLQQGAKSRRVEPGDIAILVRTRARGRELVAQLRAAGLPATVTAGSSVFSTAAATYLVELLTAVVEPTSSNISQAALGPLLPGDFDSLIRSPEAVAPAARAVHALAATAEESLSAMIRQVLSDENTAMRVMTLPDGEQLLIDLRQLGELLQTLDASSVAQLRDWLADQQHQNDEDDATSQRYAGDHNSIMVRTIHSAKGLDFPIVLLPQVSATDVNFQDALPITRDGQRSLLVGPKQQPYSPLGRQLTRAARDEELRLLYVGLTRAKHLAIAWHMPDKRSASGPLTALLCRDRTSSELADRYASYPSAFSLDSNLVSITQLSLVEPGETWAAPHRQSSRPTAAVFTRVIDQQWRRTSYSELTAGLHEVAGDEPLALDVAALPPESGITSPMADLPSGAGFGSLVHATLEELDWRCDLGKRITSVLSELVLRFGFDPALTPVLATAIEQICLTPLGPLAPGMRLCDFERRLPELDFDLPLANLGQANSLARLATLWQSHLEPADPLANYPAKLADSPAASRLLSGFLTGSIDAVLQRSDGAFLVVDYKTNRLPTGPDETLTTGHYTPAAMADAMIQAHYPLQALLYSVALHRYLGWRLPDYDPDKHLGGAGYLFVRGMAGAATPIVAGQPCGVFYWHPTTALVTATSDLLAGADVN